VSLLPNRIVAFPVQGLFIFLLKVTLGQVILGFSCTGEFPEMQRAVVAYGALSLLRRIPLHVKLSSGFRLQSARYMVRGAEYEIMTNV
jgi:hypothetical protein